MRDKVKVSGKVTAVVREADGRSWTISGNNLVTTVGEGLFAGLLTGTGDPPSHLAMGTSNQAATLADTDLVGTEHEREAATVTAVGNVLTIAATFIGTGSDVSVGEFGIFNDDPGGDLVARWVTPLFTMPATAEIDVSWQLTIGE